MKKHLGLETTNLLLEKWILLRLMRKLLMVNCVFPGRFELSCFSSSITAIASTFILWYQDTKLYSYGLF